MKDVIFVLFETDVFKTKSSRVLKGVFTSRELAEQHAIMGYLKQKYQKYTENNVIHCLSMF